MTLQLLISDTAAPRPPARPCRRGAFLLALRAGRLGVESAAAVSQLDVAYEKAAACEGGSGHQSPAQAAPTGTGTGDLATIAFETARQNLYPPDPIGGWLAATDSDAEVQLWRLGVTGLRWALPWVEEARARAYCHSLEVAWQGAELGSGWMASGDPLRLPPSPPRPVAAALAGGLLPCLEYLLRGAGRDPGGWQAAAVGELAWLGRHMELLLAYGDAGEAAALVATLGKLLRRALTDPRVVEGISDSQSTFWQAVPLMVFGPLKVDQNLSQDQQAPEGTLEAAGAEPEAAAAGVAGAAPGPASPASQQLASLLSFAACRWLPPLSRLAQHSLRADIGRGDGSGDSGGRGGCGSSGASGIAYLTASLLLSASLSWVPLLRACCGPQAAHRAPAPEGAGGSEGDGCGDDGGWRALLLEEVEVVPLLGVALDFLPELEAAGLSNHLPLLLKYLARCSGHLAALLLSDTARGSAPDAAGPSSGGARARRLLRTCANPGCANLDGDSEAGLRLTPCAGCGPFESQALKCP
ncbi:hypothetical protein GPECTOR_20g496 [Gonium pectorale]|uniref:Uncharacterized protein n=1 Tax=Gonium pectorale TaxID=33097 RepID=A0A150GIJ5_GONPE|nr:hypothetical protein GPECTOR_20g496 [Gonium pectorale]|eukprot:KXZ49639.1 hypothetical protein GPECTOR_20g496 [Gonium pectorale]